MYEFQTHFTKRKKSDIKDHILKDSIYMTFGKNKARVTKIRSSISGHWGLGERIDCKGAKGNFWTDGDALYDCEDGSQMYIFLKLIKLYI